MVRNLLKMRCRLPTFLKRRSHSFTVRLSTSAVVADGWNRSFRHRQSAKIRCDVQGAGRICDHVLVMDDADMVGKLLRL